MSDNHKLEVSANEFLSLSDIQNIKTYVDFAGVDKENNLILLGWVFDPETIVKNFAVLSKTQSGLLKKTTYQVKMLDSGIDNIYISRVSRLDVSQAMSAPESNEIMHGFVIVIPQHKDEDIIALCMADGKYLKLSFNTIRKVSEINSAFKKLWPHSGETLTNLLSVALSNESDLVQQAVEISDINDNFIQIQKNIAIDHVMLLDRQALIINGWISKRQDEIERIELNVNGNKLLIASVIKRYVRPDLYQGLPWSKGQALGYIYVLTDLPQPLEDIKIKIEFTDGSIQSVNAGVKELEWPQMPEFLNINSVFAQLLLESLKDAEVNHRRQIRWNQRISQLISDRIQALHLSLSSHSDQLPLTIAAIDRSYPMGKDGILFFGWHLLPERKPETILLIDDEGCETNITHLMFPLRRLDVVQAYASRIPKINEWVGFVCYVAVPTMAGESRALCFDFSELGKIYLKIPTEKIQSNALSVVKEVLGMIPEPNQMRYKLYDLFNSGFGNAIDQLNEMRSLSHDADYRQFGQPVNEPEITVLIPLYGRYDFLRHQLAQFADDQDFKKTDLIYIVDDPTILNATLELAAKYQPLFNISFRIIWNGENRGFAAANNLGARFAKSPYLVLLNSDVIPQQNGWLTVLKNSLDALPQAGAVAPLLQFGDSTIQHAGMYPREDLLLPGFLLNTHRGMGVRWDPLQNMPSEQPMLTAACLMIKKSEYLSIGGLDEGYLLGDFEDSDLCLSLRKKDLKLYLVPEAKLWHLERQSQTLEDLASVRQMVTLFNSWRYLNKIKMGMIPAPSTFEVSK